MPIHLPQLTRRAFLKRAALAGAALACAPTAQAGLFGKARDKHTFALFSDTHTPANPATVVRNVNPAEHLAACVRELTAWPVKPAAIIVNGDLAYSAGLPKEYATFSQGIEPVRALAPVHLLLGNHDHRENFWSAFPHDATRPQATLARQASVLASPRANWFLLDSLDVTQSTPGELGAAQLAWLDRELTLRPKKPAIVVCHHSFDLTGRFGLKDSLALDDLFGRHRQVKAFIYGHTHNWQVEPSAGGVHFINLPPTGYVFAAGRPSGWVRLTLARDGMELELRSLDPKHPEHAQVKKLQWRTT